MTMYPWRSHGTDWRSGLHSRLPSPSTGLRRPHGKGNRSACAAQCQSRRGTCRASGGKSRGVTAFLGIPYAAPPTGNLRSGARRSPRRPGRASDRRIDLRRAVRSPCRAHQPSLTSEFLTSGEQSEDCLYLNVWTPARSASERNPSSFICTEVATTRARRRPDLRRRWTRRKGARRRDLELPARAARVSRSPGTHPRVSASCVRQLSDCWTNRRSPLGAPEHRCLGGDPDRVTVAGQSAGAQDVHHLTASPLRRDSSPQDHRAERLRVVTTQQRVAMRDHRGSCERFVTAKGVGSLPALRALTWQQLIGASRAFRGNEWASTELPRVASDRWLRPSARRRSVLRTGQTERCADVDRVERG